MTPALIALDWGTSSLRGYAIAADGAVLEDRAEALGIMQVADGDFHAALRRFCGDWLDAWPAAALLASGMIGSKQGWQEAPYCPCPADAEAIAQSVIHVDVGGGRVLHIVPGVSFLDPQSGVPDVMRGEETQIIGAVPQTGTQLVVLPGTHSKWVRVHNGVIESFSSWMTGEIYAALVSHTILGRLMAADAPHDADAFARGIGYGFEQPSLLLSRLFSARTLGLFEKFDAAALPSYLSGLLIGTEIGAATGRAELANPLLLLGSLHLTERYATACTLAGWATTAGEDDSAARGLYRLARAASLLD